MKLSTWKKKHSRDRLSERAIRDARTLDDAPNLRDAAREFCEAQGELHDWIADAWAKK